MVDHLGENLRELADRIRDGVTHPDGRVVVFAGAALSMAGPAYLPPAAPLVRSMLDALLRGEAVARILDKSQLSAETLVREITGKSLVPEALYQTLSDIAGLAKLIDALRLLKGGAPNANHWLLAALARAGSLRLVLTTNFDDLLERALIEEAQPFEVCVGAEVTSDRIASTFEAAAAHEPVLIWKIHGDIADAEDPARHHRIVTTLNQIGAAPSRAVAEGLEAALRDRAVLVLGYSANDRDLAGKLEALDCKRLFWNTLGRDRPQDSAIDRIMARHPDAARWLVGDINEVLGALARELGVYEAIASKVPRPFCRLTEEEWQHELVDATRTRIEAWDDDPARRIEPPRKILVIATILRGIGNPAAGVALGRAALPADGPIGGEIVFELGRAYQRLGSVAEAESAFRDALNAFEREGRPGAQTFPLVELAGLASLRGDSGAAFDYASRALKLAEQAREPTVQANASMELAHQYKITGETDQAESYATRARRLYAEVQSVGGEAHSLAFLGSLAELRGRLGDADALYREVLSLSRLTGDAREEATALNRLGEILRLQREFIQALPYYEQAAELYTRAGDLDGQGAVFNNIGIVLTELGSLDRAEELLRQSIAIHEQIRDVEGEAQAWQNLGNIFFKRTDWPGAADAYGRAQKLYQDSHNLRGLAFIEVNFGGILLLGRRDIPGALTRYGSAQRAFAAIGDRDSEAGVSRTLAGLYEAIGQQPEAARWLQHAQSLESDARAAR